MAKSGGQFIRICLQRSALYCTAHLQEHTDDLLYVHDTTRVVLTASNRTLQAARR